MNFNQKSIFNFILVSLIITSCVYRNSSIAWPERPEMEKENVVEDDSLLKDLDNDCFRPYNDSSIWNRPIDWSVARIHPDSKKMMDAFWAGTAWMGSDSSQFAPNIYFVDSATPLVSVQLRNNRFRDAFDDIKIIFGEPASLVWMPLPSHARPSPGTDGQLAVVNMDTGEEWGIIKGFVDPLGKWFADGAYRYSINGSGIPPLGFGQRGAGIGQLAGVVRPCEVERGYIGHAVTLAYDFPCSPQVCEKNGWPAVIHPFTKTDGKGLLKYDIPEGARVIIRTDIAQADINDVCAGILGCIVWVHAMQEYGGVIVDRSNHPKTTPEGDATAQWDPNIWSKDMLRNVPSDWYEVLDWNYQYLQAP